MTDNTHIQQIFQFFAEILEYPQHDLGEILLDGESLLAKENVEAKIIVQEFHKIIEDFSVGKLQEIYTNTFDLDATYHPYVGHHLFGESYKRSAFMVGLKQRYKHVNLEIGSEVADNLGVMLRYLSLCNDEEQTQAIIHEAILPAIKKMIRKGIVDDKDISNSNEEESPKLIYKNILIALQKILQEQPMGDTIPIVQKVLSFE